MLTKTTFITILSIILLSFSGDNELIEFSYPKEKTAKFTMPAVDFKKFKKEWRGEDYYYMCDNADSKIICSVLFYRLNKEEQKMMVKPFGDKPSASIPFVYFSENSNLKKYEKNNASWGEPTDDFMFRQNDIPDFEGAPLRQKHMYAYAMFGKDLFVNIHLSKVNCTTADSTQMRQILAGLKKVQ